MKAWERGPWWCGRWLAGSLVLRCNWESAIARLPLSLACTRISVATPLRSPSLPVSPPSSHCVFCFLAATSFQLCPCVSCFRFRCTRCHSYYYSCCCCCCSSWLCALPLSCVSAGHLSKMKPPATDARGAAPAPAGGVFNVDRNNSLNQTLRKVTGVQDFWLGYKLYCFGHYSHCDMSKEQFLASKMDRVVFLLRNEKGVLWGAKFDERVRQVWAMMEEYIRICYDKDCTNLRALMEEFEDVKELSTSENGSLLLQLIKVVVRKYWGERRRPLLHKRW